MKQSLTNFAVALIVAGVACAGYIFWNSVISAKSAVVADVEYRIVIKTEAASRITSVRTALAELEGDENKIALYFISKSEIVTFIDELEQQGKDLGSTVGVSSVSSVDSTDHPMLTLTFAIEGTFDAVMRTVGAIEYASYDLSISSFTMRQVSDRVWHADVKILVGSAEANTKKSAQTPISPTP